MNSLPHPDQLHLHLRRNLKATMMPHSPQATFSSNLHSEASANLEHEGLQPSLVMHSVQMQPEHCEMQAIQQQFLKEQNIRQQRLQELQHRDEQFKLHFQQQEQQLQEQRFKDQIHQQQLQKQRLHQQQLQQYLIPQSHHQLMQQSQQNQIIGRAPTPQQIAQKRTTITNNPSDIWYHHQAAPQNQEQLQSQLQQSPSQPPAMQRREQSIGIPSKQPDSDCEIIAVQQRGEGVPVIQSFQGANASPPPSHSDSGVLRSDSPITTPGASASALNESTIHLTDNITLTVRHPPGSASGSKEHNAIASAFAPVGFLVTPAGGLSTSPSNSYQRAQPSSPPPYHAQAPSCPKLNSPGGINGALFDSPPANPPYQANEGLAVPTPVIAPVIAPRPAPRQATPTDDTPRPPTVDLIDENAHASNAYDAICRFCDQMFTSQERLQKHLRVIHHAKKCFRCLICNSKHHSKRALRNHVKWMHKGGATGSPPELVIPLVDLKNTGAQLSSLGVNYVISLNQLGMSPDSNTFCIPIMSLDASGQARNNSISGLMSLGTSAVLPIGPVKSVPAAQQHSHQPHTQPQTESSLCQWNVDLYMDAPIRPPLLQYAQPRPCCSSENNVTGCHIGSCPHVLMLKKMKESKRDTLSNTE